MIGERTAATEIAEQRLRGHHPPGPVDSDPIAMQRHVDAALGTEIGMGLPGDVGQQAGGEPQPGPFGRIVEYSRNPSVEQRAMLVEATKPPPRLTRCLDQWIMRPERRPEIFVEQAF